MSSGFVPPPVEPPIPCISLSPCMSEQPGSVTGTVLENIMNFFRQKFSGSRVPGSIGREYTSIKFLWFKSLPGHGDIFEEVSETELQPGDILLFPESNANFVSRALFKHVAVYCGEGEVIHFQGTGTGNSGLISKQGFEALKKERGECQIYRKKGGVDLNDLRSKVRKAMDSEAEYSLYTNNCIHFALSLLGLEKFSSELVQIQDEGVSYSTGADTCSPPPPEEQRSSHTA